MKSGKYYISGISITKSPKSLQQFNQVIIIMEVHIDDNKLVITETKTFHFHFDLLKDTHKEKAP